VKSSASAAEIKKAYYKESFCKELNMKLMVHRSAFESHAFTPLCRVDLARRHVDAILTRTQEMRRQMQNSRSWPKHTRQVANVKRSDFEGSILRTGEKSHKRLPHLKAFMYHILSILRLNLFYFHQRSAEWQR